MKVIAIAYSENNSSPTVLTYTDNQEALDLVASLVSGEYKVEPTEGQNVQQYIQQYYEWVQNENNNECEVSIDISIKKIPTPTVLVQVEGGLVSSVMADRECSVEIIDYDTESADEFDVMKPYPEEDKGAYIYEGEVLVVSGEKAIATAKRLEEYRDLKAEHWNNMTAIPTADKAGALELQDEIKKIEEKLEGYR